MIPRKDASYICRGGITLVQESVTQMLLSLSLIFIVLHFTLQNELQHTGPTQNATNNASDTSGEHPVITTLANGTAASPEKLR